ncbi:MAG: hypothetical protein ACRENE_33470, partial [Polyangiaceae bacterium]
MSKNTTFDAIRATASRLAETLEVKLTADVLAIIGPILPGAEQKVRDAVEAATTKRPKLAV